MCFIDCCVLWTVFCLKCLFLWSVINLKKLCFDPGGPPYWSQSHLVIPLQCKAEPVTLTAHNPIIPCVVPSYDWWTAPETLWTLHEHKTEITRLNQPHVKIFVCVTPTDKSRTSFCSQIINKTLDKLRVSECEFWTQTQKIKSAAGRFMFVSIIQESEGKEGFCVDSTIHDQILFCWKL